MLLHNIYPSAGEPGSENLTDGAQHNNLRLWTDMIVIYRQLWDIFYKNKLNTRTQYTHLHTL